MTTFPSHYQPVLTKHNYGYEYFLKWAERYARENTFRWEEGKYTKPSDSIKSLAERIAQRNNRKRLEEIMTRSDGYYKQSNHVALHWYVQEQMDNDNEVMKVFEYDFTEDAKTNARRKAKFEKENGGCVNNVLSNLFGC